MSILLTGAAGFIGSNLAEALLARGEEVVGFDNFDPFYPRAVKEANLARARDHGHFRLVEGDIRDGAALAALPAGIDTVIHLAALPGVRPSIEDPERYAEVNVLGTVRLLGLARARGIRTFVFGSSSSVYGDQKQVPFSENDSVDRPISPYAATKKAGELHCHTASHLDGITTACLRFFTVYGPRQRPDLAIHKFARLMAAGRPVPRFGDGSTSRDYTYIDDIVDGVLRATDWARAREGVHEVVNLGESRTVTLAEMIGVLGAELGVEPTIEEHPVQPGEVERTYADVSKARRLFGYDPRTDFRDGIERFAEWMRATGPP